MGSLAFLGLEERQREAIAGYICITPWLVGFLIFTVWAMAYSFTLSFKKTDMLTPAQFVGAANYVKLLTADALFWKSLYNTAYYTLVSVPLRMVGGLVIAMLMNQEIRGIAWFRTIYYLPMVVSGVAVSLLWLWLLHPNYGLVNFVLVKLGLPAVPWLYSETWVMPALILMSLWWMGENMIIYLAGLKGIPTHLYEAAVIDGAGVWHKFLHITLPMLSPTLFFTLVMGIIYSFQVFTQSYIMTQGGPNNASLTYVLYLYRTAFQKFHMGYASALAWILFIIIMLVTFMVFKSSPLWVYYEGEIRNR